MSENCLCSLPFSCCKNYKGMTSRLLKVRLEVCQDALQFVSVCVVATQTISLSVLARNPHKRTEGEISRETGSGRGKEGPREDREGQLTKQDRREQLA